MLHQPRVLKDAYQFGNLFNIRRSDPIVIMSARFWQITGLAAAGGIGYYLYNAGGDPKLAQKKAEGKALLHSSRHLSSAANMLVPAFP